MKQNNYETRNLSIEKASDEKWGLSPKIGTIKQLAVNLGDASYDYLSRYEVKENDCVVIGNGYAWQLCCNVELAKTTGCMGMVDSVAPKVTLKKNHAAEIDFVFTSEVDKKTVEKNIKYLSTNPNEKTLQYDKETQDIYPLTYMIRKVLAATTVLAFPQFAKENDLDKAKAYILEKHIFTDKVYTLCHSGGYFPANIYLADTHTSINCSLSRLAKDSDIKGFDKKCINNRSEDDMIIRSQQLDDYVDYAVNIGSASLMIRGGFSNMLTAFLQVKQPKKADLKKLITFAQKIGSSDCEQVLNEFNG